MLLANVASILTANKIEFGFNPDTDTITAYGVDGKIMKIRADRDGVYIGRGSEYTIEEIIDMLLNGWLSSC